MGNRDDNLLDDERADVAFRRLLARSGQPAQVEPPPDIVTRSIRRLPEMPPALAARRARRRASLRRALSATVFGVLALVVVLGAWSVLGGGAPLAMLFGDGTSGLSRWLLTLHLLAKPLLGVLGALGAPLLAGGLAAAAGTAGLWWWLLRRTSAYVYAESGP
jgi:hypothetical protein